MVRRTRFSILIIFKNERRGIVKTLDSVFSQTYPSGHVEVICVNDNSIDGSEKLIKNYPIRLLRSKSTGISGARNEGIKYCSGDVILFLDAHIYLQNSNTLKQIDKLFRSQKETVGVCGEYYSVEEEDKNYVRDIRRSVLFGKNDKERFITLEAFTTWSIAIGAYKRTLFTDITFPEGFNNSYGEDTYVQIKIHNKGHRLLYSPIVTGLHDALLTDKQLINKMMLEIRATSNILLQGADDTMNGQTIFLPYLHYFLSYPLGLVISIILLTIKFNIVFMFICTFFFFLETGPLLKIITIQKYNLGKRLFTLLYLIQINQNYRAL